MKNFEIGQKVVATIGDLVWDTEIVDIVNNSKENGVWVDHPELGKEDITYVNLLRANNNIEIVQEVSREVVKETEMREARKIVEKALRWEEEDVKVSVKIYDFYEDGFEGRQQAYDVEIQWAIGEETYTDCVVTDSFYSNVEEDEVSLKDAQKRAKTVLKSVKGWFEYSDNVIVENNVEVYHA
ncbi:hypothetical protein PQE75_gp064 [Bacillus phage vB_BcoS-136]|uniref:Uncharacterized protein n=1 Tax=Bacillus phage vB_BcoS-136 TaxID=2419619 RepID=A0A3G3BVV4_9CAUD|nr:hypothetical protein PQE75_gp064 [Bacillus phage vB_BcoS-136]AYP68196.1 hypothetical protein vBBcoS136_00064 [Bacillus phage vB_BcoS-136]